MRHDIVDCGVSKHKQKLKCHKVQLSCSFRERRVERGIAVLCCTVEGHCDNGSRWKPGREVFKRISEK